MPTPANPSDPQGLRPVPDPTVLTTEALMREVSNLNARWNDRVQALDLLIDEKFKSIDQQLELVERQRVEQKMDTKAAVDAALTAQKEAVKEQTIAQGTAIAKSEAGTSEQLKAIRSEFVTQAAGIMSILNDLKDRVIKIESIKLGGQESTQERRQGNTATAAIIGLVVTVALAAITIVGFIAANTGR